MNSLLIFVLTLHGNFHGSPLIPYNIDFVQHGLTSRASYQNPIPRCKGEFTVPCCMLFEWYCKGKDKVHSCTGTEALYRPYGLQGCRGIALLFLDHGTRRGWGVCVTSWPLFTLGKDPVPIVQSGWAPGPFSKILAPHRESIPGQSSPVTIPTELPGPQVILCQLSLGLTNGVFIPAVSYHRQEIHQD